VITLALSFSEKGLKRKDPSQVIEDLADTMAGLHMLLAVVMITLNLEGYCGLGQVFLAVLALLE
jgi:hypothetical protein